MADTLHAREGDALDGLLARERGLGPEDLGPVLAGNPGLAALGPLLPIGTPVSVPAIVVPAARELPLIQLWD
ncbi:tail protein X [Sphingomonas jatrophae]|uniref:P2-like prophage tail protein X n=1 Tax=Sphingomonas jatrophae TaxID=1166337 RepID=A0A1I6JLF9_9SPHN|nr:tail protein X [Sphingomonas jatrophae]SFR79818.1 P2-like prophage tail protein X [Sphingomonas jatrophae]